MKTKIFFIFLIGFSLKLSWNCKNPNLPEQVGLDFYDTLYNNAVLFALTKSEEFNFIPPEAPILDSSSNFKSIILEKKVEKDTLKSFYYFDREFSDFHHNNNKILVDEYYENLIRNDATDISLDSIRLFNQSLITFIKATTLDSRIKIKYAHIFFPEILFKTKNLKGFLSFSNPKHIKLDNGNEYYFIKISLITESRLEQHYYVKMLYIDGLLRKIESLEKEPTKELIIR